jgi:hypothetical protein
MKIIEDILNETKLIILDRREDGRLYARTFPTLIEVADSFIESQTVPREIAIDGGRITFNVANGVAVYKLKERKKGHRLSVFELIYFSKG